ncbi:2,4-dichlorophenol 6-monooxygenase [Planoprotostelium fungivorum]|uniref:2,4-dichlorophenol 6-monooxygenase n=1 Tax=Planoprotostelium fungivorum TaxID=1890364 RepID=A0A2P6N0V5_9EUKA|nr:2,4-dichlorophenol 6-monooxygenase [Planoprotostelium fungivorum]
MLRIQIYSVQNGKKNGNRLTAEFHRSLYPSHHKNREQQEEQHMTEHVPIVIVGGGLVGLSAAAFIASRGVKPVLIEKHPGSSLHPRAMGYTARTMELFRSIDLEKKIPQIDASFRLRRVKVESMAGKWFEETHWSEARGKDGQKGGKGDHAPSAMPSPCMGAAIAQDRLEPIIRTRALEFGADIRLNTQVTSIEQDDECVTLHLKDRLNRSISSITADYVIAADGHSSPIREALGIKRSGRGHMQTVKSVLFRETNNKLEEYKERGYQQFSIEQPDLKAFVTTYSDGRWVLMYTDDVEREPSAHQGEIRKAVGRDDIDIDIITTGCWDLSALIADTFSSGRIFLVGDSAHQLPPNRGGYGANTGIEDAHNIAWKLVEVLEKRARPELLATYDAERRPIAWLRHDQIFARSDYSYQAGENGKKAITYDDAAMELGQLYRSAAIVGAGSELPPAATPEEWNGQPGTRAPHLYVSMGEDQISTLDLFQKGWVLFCSGEHWKEAAAVNGIPTVDLDTDLRHGEELRRELGINMVGASLIRPDGYIAWRRIGTEAPITETPKYIFPPDSSPGNQLNFARRRRPAENMQGQLWTEYLDQPFPASVLHWVEEMWEQESRLQRGETIPDSPQMTSSPTIDFPSPFQLLEPLRHNQRRSYNGESRFISPRPVVILDKSSPLATSMKYCTVTVKLLDQEGSPLLEDEQDHLFSPQGKQFVLSVAHHRTAPISVKLTGKIELRELRLGFTVVCETNEGETLRFHLTSNAFHLLRDRRPKMRSGVRVSGRGRRGPCCGKTTLLEAIQKLNIGGVNIVFEMARTYIDEKMEQGLSLQEIRKDPWQFQTEVLKRKVELEDELLSDPSHRVILMERGIPDSIAYGAADGGIFPADQLSTRHARENLRDRMWPNQ